MRKILVIGALGQVGKELVEGLNAKFGIDQVIPSDIREENAFPQKMKLLDVLDYEGIKKIVEEEQVDTVYNLAALLSATGEKKPLLAWDINMKGLINTLELAKEGKIKKLFWPSSIAVFGPNTPKQKTPQYTITEPSTVYGISKLAGERWCEYYAKKFGVDVRSVRYPGLIGWKSMPGGGTTDYAVDIFHKAVKNEHFECFLAEDSSLPMMYMDDAIEASIRIMEQDAANIKIRSSYNINGCSFSPKELTAEIQKHQPNFQSTYNPDFRQEIAASWPSSIDDTEARKDWAWNPKYNLSILVEVMLKNLEHVA